MTDTKEPNYPNLAATPNYGELNEEVLAFWKENNIFEKSVENRPKGNSYVFYDGPPFVTGLPHYGHLLSGIAKDLVPRFWTMKGKRVERVWGWDCHGLPIENKVEKTLGLNSRRDIEKVGLEKFISECFKYVSDISSEWDWYVDHSGRWVDMKHAYRTLDKNYMESVWWVFKTIYEKDLIYRGKRVSLYCTHCGTPISNFEVAMDNSYSDVTEVSNTYKYQLAASNQELREKLKIESPEFTDDKKVFILAWSTTPWNKLATPALAVNPKMEYCLVKQGEEYLVLAQTTLKILKEEPYTVLATFSGSLLEGLHFQPHYDFYEVEEGKQVWVIIGGDFVTADEGTGVVTLAIYGEDDFKVMVEKNVAQLEHVNEEGYLTIPAPWQGMYYLDANPKVNEDLAQRGLMYREDKITHSVAMCWRCATRLMYKPQSAWFLRVSSMKDHLVKTNEDINWFPEHLKHGRFQKGIESAPDWCISRTRYWATPMPVWQCNKDEEHRHVIGSVSELEQLTGQVVNDLHRPYIDEYTFPCEKCDGEMTRVSDVLDSWMDAGSMPYAQVHYPFENKELFEANFPADYIVEYVAQTRAWFYVLHVLSNALFDKNSFKNVICTGVIQGNDGRKMSKSFGNYPDPKRVLQTYGGDAFRLYLMSSPIMAAENLNINENEIKEQNQRNLSILWNSVKYFITYANLHDFNGDEKVALDLAAKVSDNVIDQWILTKLKELTLTVDSAFTEYNLPKGVRLLKPFIADLSTWYIRRCRDRFVAGDKQALQTMYTVLYRLSLVMAPITPFIAEKMYQTFKGENGMESVHLCNWPEYSALTEDEKSVLQNMELVREVCSLGNEARKRLNLPTRQPLAGVVVKTNRPEFRKDFWTLVMGELNVKASQWNQDEKATTLTVELDTTMTAELQAEGDTRKLIREIQNARKKAGVARETLVKVTLPDWPAQFEDEIKQKTMARELVKGEVLMVEE